MRESLDRKGDFSPRNRLSFQSLVLHSLVMPLADYFNRDFLCGTLMKVAFHNFDI